MFVSQLIIECQIIEKVMCRKICLSYEPVIACYIIYSVDMTSCLTYNVKNYIMYGVWVVFRTQYFPKFVTFMILDGCFKPCRLYKMNTSAQRVS